MFKFLTSVVLFVMALIMLPSLVVARLLGFGQVRDRGRVRVARRAGVDRPLLAVRSWYASPMRSSQWDELLLPAIYRFFDIGRTLRPNLRTQLFNVQSSTRSKEESVGHGGVPAEAWDTYNASGQVGTADFNQGYKSTYEHGLYPIRMEIEKTLLEDDQYGVISDYSRKLGISAATKMERDAASVFNNAFSSSFLGGDGKALCSTTHPRNPNKSGNLVNKGTSALTKAAVSTTRQAIMATEDDAGNILGMTPDMLLVPPELEDAALEIAQSAQDPASANNAINPQAGRFQVVPWHFLTDSNNWFMIDSVWMRESLRWYDRVALEFMMVDETSVHVVYEARMRYSFGWDDWRWVYGHEVSGS